MASSVKVMEKPPNHQENLQKLRCPRCDSSNTKFCYYNNYSLSQPRHFCKACKRYWTRGGTLRNVPVGGGCRKNKRMKKPTPPSTTSDHQSTSLIRPSINHHQIDVSKASNNHLNSMFFRVPNPSDTNLTIPNFHSSMISSSSGYDYQSQFNTMGLSFSSTAMNTGVIDQEDYRNGYHNPTNQLRDLLTSNSLLSNFSLLGSSITSSTTAPTTASLAGTGLQQQQGMQVVGNNDSDMDTKGVKTEEERNKVDWGAPYDNSMDPIGSSDPSFYWNSSSNVGTGAWPDLSNYGSSVTPLI